MRNVLSSLLNPRAVAVVGSASPGKLGAVLFERILDGGYQSVYSVNPKAMGVMGRPGYASVSEIPDQVDLVVIASPSATVAGALEDAGKAGVKSAVVISSGFSEAGNYDLEAEALAVAARYGVRFVGPNCAGILNNHNGLIATLEAAPPKGGVALVSQSGAIGGMCMDAAKKQGLGIGKFISFGNAADLDAANLLTAFSDDPESSAIALYIENIKDGRAFMKALAEATAKKPVVIIKSGRTEGGQRAARSHTGAMAGADAVYDAAFRKCGAIRASSVDEMIDLMKALTANVEKPLCGKRVCILTNSGGPGVLTADRAETLGLSVTAPEIALKEALSEILPAYAGLSNPIDVTVEGTPAQYGGALQRILSDYDAAIVIYIGTPYLAAKPIASAVAAAAAEFQKPVSAFFAVGPDIDEAIALLQDAGVPCHASGERAADGLRGCAAYDRSHGLLKADVTPQKLKRQFLLEPDCMALLSEAGVPVPPHRLVVEREEAAAAAGEIGFPVCMKIVSKDILHKSDVGGVILNVSGAEEAKAAFDRLKSICRGKDFSGVILYPMLKKGVELIMGLTRDATFGPVVLFGLGGVFTEALSDVAMGIAPLSLEEAQALIGSVRGKKLLQGFRGAAPCDMTALAETLRRLSLMMFRYGEIMELDINPVMAYEKGVLAADARILLR